MQPVPYSPASWLTFLRKSDDALLSLCRTDYYKATGKGGQKRNKTENAVRLTLSDLMVTDASTRSRAKNLQQALRKMRLAIAMDIDDAVHKRSQFHQFPQEVVPYVSAGLIRINPSNPVFPLFIASLIDVYVKYSGDWKKTATEFQVSVSQIQKFARKHGLLSTVFNQLDMQLKEGN